jgi:glycosyltransferase involved in cell wall biosynthesis
MKIDNKISIILPTFGRSAELSRALESITKQTYTNYEVLIVDDNGIDTKKQRSNLFLYNEYKNRIPELHYIPLARNSGGSVARNMGLSKATGKYVTFLDDDDEFYPNKLERQLRFIQQQFPNDDGFVNCQMNVYKGDKFVRKIKTRYDKDNLLFSALAEKILGTPSLFIPYSLINKTGGFTDRIKGQEWDLIVRLVSHGAKFAHQPMPLVKVNISANSITTTKNLTVLLEGVLGIFKTQRQYFQKLSHDQVATIKHFHLLKLSDIYFDKNLKKSIRFILIALKYRPFSKALFRHLAKCLYVVIKR